MTLRQFSKISLNPEIMKLIHYTWKERSYRCQILAWFAGFLKRRNRKTMGLEWHDLLNPIGIEKYRNYICMIAGAAKQRIAEHRKNVEIVIWRGTPHAEHGAAGGPLWAHGWHRPPRAGERPDKEPRNTGRILSMYSLTMRVATRPSLSSSEESSDDD